MSDVCTFCDRSQFEERIIAESAEWYAIASLGQIVEGYTLLVPKRHLACMAEWPEGIAYAGQMRGKIAEVYGSPVITFEHGIVGQTIPHAHLHLLPAAVSITGRMVRDFSGFGFVLDGEHLAQSYRDLQQPYLYWTTPSGRGFACWNPPAPKQHLRTVIAELLGVPERADWRTMDPVLDKRLWQATVSRLAPLFRG